MVEFALIIGVLFMIIFVVIEAGHLLQANLTVQNAARAGGRYAITGQFETDCLIEDPPCADPRVVSIQSVAEEALSGLSLDPDAGFEDPGFYLIEVFGADAQGNLLENSAGMPGRPIIVRVSYRAAILTPLLRPIAETVMVTGQTIMNNERVVQIGTAGESEAPPVPIPPPIEPTPAPPPDLALTKSAPTSVLQGATFKYTLTLVNNGQQAATSVVLTDNLDSNLISTISVSNPACSLSASTVTCTWPSLAVGEQRTVAIDATAAGDGAGETIENVASVGANEDDANDADNTSNVVKTTIVATTTQTDLEIVKTGPEAAPVSLPDNPYYVDYLITVRNNGPNTATDVTVTDALDSGLSFHEAGSFAGCSAGPPVTCQLGDLHNGQSATFTIRARTPLSEATLTNTATVSAHDHSDLAPGNESSSHTTQFIFLADLNISKTGSPSTIFAGQQLTYVIDVSNQGPHTATGVNITDPLPNFVKLASAEVSVEGGQPSNCSLSGSTVTCPVGNLEVGQSALATIIVIPQRAGTLTNSAQVAAAQNDPDVLNSASAVTLVDAESDLSIVKSVDPQDPFAGDLISYSLDVHNDGPSPATGVRVVDDLPAEVVFNSVTTDYGSCDWSSLIRRVTCWLGVLPAGEDATIVITAMPVVPDKEFTNQAQIFGNEDDPFDNNNSAVATTARRGDPFIFLNPPPACGPGGASLEIEGRLWSAQSGQGQGSNRDITVWWEDETGNRTTIAQVSQNSLVAEGHFSVPFTIPEDARKETFTIGASQREATGNENHVDTKEFNVPCPNPDLEVTSLTAGANTAEQYAPIDFTVTVKNTGNEIAGDPFYVSLYALDALPADGEQPLFSEENRLDVATLNALDVDESRTLFLSAPNGFATAGTVYFYAVVDSDPAPDGAVVEMYEDNNLSEPESVVVAESETTPEDPPVGEQTFSAVTNISDGDDQSDGTFLEPQPFVRVSIYDVTSKMWLGTAFSSYPDAQVEFTDLPEAEEFLVEASITVDDIVYSFTGALTSSASTIRLTAEE